MVNNTLMTWRVVIQKSVSLSSMEAEYMAMCENTKEEYGVPSKEGYFKKLSEAFKDFKKMVSFNQCVS